MIVMLIILLLLLLLLIIIIIKKITTISSQGGNKCRNPDFFGFSKTNNGPCEVHGGELFVHVFVCIQ